MIDVIFMLVASVVVTAVAAYILAGAVSGPGKAGTPLPSTGARGNKRVLAFVNGYPGAGKTTLCGLLSMYNITVKDMDYFTQPVFNSRHPLSKTPEGKSMFKRYQSHAVGSPELERENSFFRKEISAYYDSLPDGALVVFCGLVPSESAIPAAMRGTKMYWIEQSPLSAAMRSGIRNTVVNADHIRDCASFEEMYVGEYKMRYEINSKYNKTTGQGGMSTPDIISEILASAGVGEEGARDAVKRFESIPGEQQELARLAKSAGCEDHDVERLLAFSPRSDEVADGARGQSRSAPSSLASLV